jgi:hypothetical protein
VEGGNATTIALDSPFDFNSQDMLVKVTEPRFAYNRQKYIGSLLQTSMRYEADGWFAGWWGHNFVLRSNRNDYCQPPLNDNDDLNIIKLQDENGNYVYSVTHRDIGLVYTVSTALWESWLIGSGTIARVSDGVSRVTGITNNGSDFIIDVNPYTGAAVSFTSADTTLQYTTYKNGENVRVEIKRGNELSVNDYVLLRLNNTITFNDVELPYTYEAGMSHWASLQYPDATLQIVPEAGSEFAVVSQQVYDYLQPTERTHVTLKNTSVDELTFDFEYTNKWVADQFGSSSPIMKLTATSVDTPENTQAAETVWVKDSNITHDNAAIFRYGLPIWLQHRLEMTYNVQFYGAALPDHIANTTWDIVFTDKDDNPINVADSFIQGITAYSFITQANSPLTAVTKIGDGWYRTIQPDNPRYTVVSLDINAGLYVPATFQPYEVELNPAWDPRPTIVDSVAYPTEPYGCIVNPDYNGGVTEQFNTAKRIAAETAYSIADIKAIPDILPITEPEAYYIYDGTTTPVADNPDYKKDPRDIAYDPRPVVLGIDNPGYQPDPLLPNYDPRQYIPDPAVPTWAIISITNPDYDDTVVQFLPVTPNYIRYFISNSNVVGLDWDGLNRPYWQQWWPTIPKPVIPTPQVPDVNPYNPNDVLELSINIYGAPPFDVDYYQPKVDDEPSPPNEQPYSGALTIAFNDKKSILHAIEDISNRTDWEWAYIQVRQQTQTYWIRKPYYTYSSGGHFSSSSSTVYHPGKIGTRTYTWYYDSYGVRSTGVPALAWRPISEGLQINVQDRERYNAQSWASDFINDQWILYLRCKNNYNQYPIPVNQANDGSNYFRLSLTCNGNFRQNNNLLQISSKTFTWPAYTAMPYNNNYNVLNKESLQNQNDRGIWQWDNGNCVLNIPLCVQGWAVSLIETPDILKSDLSAFRLINNIPNSDARVQQLMWRIDGLPILGLNICIAQLSSVDDTSYYISVSYIPSNNVTYYLKMQPFSKDLSTNVITSYTEYVYPEWIRRNNMSKLLENAACGVFTVASQTVPTIVNVSTVIEKRDFIAYAELDNKVLTPSPYNSNLFTNVVQSISVTPPSVPDHTQHVKLYVDSTLTEYTEFDYDPDYDDNAGRILNVVHQYSTWERTGFEINSTKTGKDASQVLIYLRSTETFEYDFMRTFINQKLGLMLPVSLISQDSTKITFNSGYGYVNIYNGTLIDATDVQYVDSMRPTVPGHDEIAMLQIYVGINNSAIVYFKPEGIVQKSSDLLVYDSITESADFYEVTFTYDGTEHILYIDKKDGARTYLSYTCTDIRTGEVTEVYQRDLIDIMQFVKQFWSNTVDIENYWWIDSTHVLELSKHQMTLYKKIGLNASGLQDVHDWNGDNWEIQKQSNRSIFIDTEDLFYMATSAYNTSALFFKLRAINNAVRLMYLDPLTANFAAPIWRTIDIPVKHYELGQPLADGKSIRGYCFFDINGLVTTTKVSSTVCSNHLLIGIKQANGLMQWCIDVDLNLNNSWKVLVGYGSVGHNGSLTGGQIPAQYWDNVAGFNATVQPISALPKTTASVNSIPNMVVGTISQQWFVQSVITNIISHCTFNNGIFTPAYLPINNNISTMYSYVTKRQAQIQDFLPQSLNIVSLFGQSNAALSILAGLISPSVFYFNLYYAIFVGIANSIGTYSYVWRNSNLPQKASDDKLTDIDVAFNKFNAPLTQAIDNTGMHIWAKIIMHMIENIPEIVTSGIVNAAQGTQTTDDSTGRKFSQAFEDMVGSAMYTALTSNGFNVRVQSTAVANLTLAMCYSINDKIECHAGPGFVNHNLKSQCMAQGMQDLQVSGKQAGYYSMLTQLSTVILEQQYRIYKNAYDGLESVKESLENNSVDISPGASVNWGSAAALGVTGGMKTIGALMAVQKAILGEDGNGLNRLGEAFGGLTKGFYAGGLEAHVPIAEGLHAYGNKSMSFFWPAFGCNNTQNTFTNEAVQAVQETINIQMALVGSQNGAVINVQNSDSKQSNGAALHFTPMDATGTFGGATRNASIPIIKCQGKSSIAQAPEGTAIVEGTTTYLTQTPFKNEQIGVRPPQFGPPMIHDFEIEPAWKLGITAGAGEIISVTCDDTKLIDGPPSNIVITDRFCGIASSYIAMEVKNIFDAAYLRPFLATANSIGLNINRINCVHDAKAYHAFDGQVNRIVSWVGGSGMDKELLYQQYLFQMNDHFKRSNIFPPAQFFGNFNGPPVVAVRSYDLVSNTVVELTSGTGFNTNTPGEDRNLMRFSTCVFSEPLSSLPTTVRMLAPYKLHVVEGITALTTDIRSTQTRYKAPTSVDFNIAKDLYRHTEEYICSIVEKTGIVALSDKVPSAGLTFIGPSMTEAYFYSPATRLYYAYSGGTQLSKKATLSRFVDLKVGRWDFINQEVIFNAQLGQTRENMVLRLDGDVLGEVWPPNETIYNERSGFKLYSCAGGLVYQGPKRFIVSRFIPLEHMIPETIDNKRKWVKVKREDFVYNRDYGWHYEDWYTITPPNAVEGWTHNPYLLVTSFLGTDEESDNKYEWQLTFAWTEMMEAVFMDNEYVTINIMAETITQGGTVRQRPTHLFLNKESFTRSGNAGYYTFKFTSANGAGNRERLFIWSDGIIAMSDIKLDIKQITAARTQPVNIQADIQDRQEL